MTSQEAVLDFLRAGEGAAFGPVSAPVRQIDTHGASIFLIGDKAWKLKRAVRYPYLDFSTVELRRQALCNELELNRRTAPDLYLGVHAITRNEAGRLTLDGAGDVVDWVLEMRWFPDGALLSDMADKGSLSMGDLQALVDGISAFHARAPIVSAPDGFARFAAVVEGNVASLDTFAAGLGREDVARLIRALRSALADGADLLRQRGLQGRVRHVHGDLHLANIAMIDGVPTPFDCLEFDAELATTDTLYDIAFLMMDLWQRGLKPEANSVFNRYCDLNGQDEDGVALMPLFLATRAAVRAHVLAAQAERAGASLALAEGARHYLRLALDFLVPCRLGLVAVGGLSGSGKSTVARGIAPFIGRAPGARVLRSDVLRKRLAGHLPESRLPVAAYTRENTARVYDCLTGQAARSLRSGVSVVVDAVFAHETERAHAGQIAVEAGVRFRGFWLDCAEDVRVARVGLRQGDASDADAAVARAQTAYAISALGDWVQVDASGLPQTVIDTVRQYLQD
ncbi:MAG: AAA family ATPase [Novosphingobium sp.]